jgi:hypothetical protein
MTSISRINFMHVLLYRGLNLLCLRAQRINPKSKVLTETLVMQLPTLRRGCQMECYSFLKTILKTKAASSPETPAIIYQSTWRHIPKYPKLRVFQLLYFSHRLIFQNKKNYREKALFPASGEMVGGTHAIKRTGRAVLNRYPGTKSPTGTCRFIPIHSTLKLT